MDDWKTPMTQRVLRHFLLAVTSLFLAVSAHAQSLIRDTEIEHTLRECARGTGEGGVPPGNVAVAMASASPSGMGPLAGVHPCTASRSLGYLAGILLEALELCSVGRKVHSCMRCLSTSRLLLSFLSRYVSASLSSSCSTLCPSPLPRKAASALLLASIRGLCVFSAASRA